MYIKDIVTGKVRLYGENHHDALRISDDGRYLVYENLQNSGGSEYGEYRFVIDEKGLIPAEDEVLVKHGADAYFNIGGWDKRRRWIPKDLSNGQVFIHVFGIDAWKQMIEFSNLNEQFREYWNAPYKEESKE